MKAVSAVVVTLLLLGAGAAAEAATWWPTKRLPKAIDTPFIRPKTKDSHKPGNKAKHPPQVYSQATAASASATA